MFKGFKEFFVWGNIVDLVVVVVIGIVFMVLVIKFIYSIIMLLINWIGVNV